MTETVSPDQMVERLMIRDRRQSHTAAGEAHADAGRHRPTVTTGRAVIPEPWTVHYPALTFSIFAGRPSACT